MSDQQNIKILLVDDDKFLSEMYAAKFAQAGFSPEVHLSATSALEAIRGGFEPAVILFDITMPEMDGYAFLDALRKEGRCEHALKIALTNQSDDAEKRHAEELGADRYIVKASMIPSEVVATVKEELAKHT